MKRALQGHYVTISTVSEKVRAFVPAPLPPRPPIDWTSELRSKFDQALLGRHLRVPVLPEEEEAIKNKRGGYRAFGFRILTQCRFGLSKIRRTKQPA